MKEELIRKLSSGEALTSDNRSELLGLLEKKKQYGIVWEDKPEDIEKQLVNEIPVLHEVAERAIVSEEEDSPNHVLIEGDNLHALTTLSYTHVGKIDLIYIDPPYNTGNKDFVYNDFFVDKEDNYRHSKWLSFMEKRLTIAKRLLSDEGAVFISIDDNEVAQSKLLCDEVFGDRNFVANILRKVKSGAGHDSKLLSIEHEYILVYAKNKEKLEFSKHVQNVDDDNKYRFEDEYVGVRGKYYLRDLQYGSSKNQASNWEIECPDGYLMSSDEHGKDGHEWRWGQKKVLWGIKNDFVVFKKQSSGKWKVYIKQYQFVDNKGNSRVRTIPYSAYIDEYLNAQGTQEISSILGSKIFSYPKPVDLIKHLIGLCSNKNATILDFFAGSGTTLHAVMKKNEEDGGNRKCILVTNNENEICEDVTYERNKRVIEGFESNSKVSDTLLEQKLTLSQLKKADKLLEKAETIKAQKESKYAKIKSEIKDGVFRLVGEYDNKENIPGLTHNSLRYYRTAFVPRERSNQTEQELVLNATSMLCIKEDIYHAEQQFGRFKTHPQLLGYFKDEKKHMLVIYREEIVKQVAEEIETMDFDKPLIVYTFSTNNNPHTDEFSEVLDKVRLTALPKAIYAAYKDVLPEQATLKEEGGEE